MNKSFWLVISILVGLLVGSYFVWDSYFNDDQAREFERFEKEYVEAMKSDNYGGKTPQETLDLLISALDKGDVELAAKYFMLDDNLSRDKWIATFQQLKEKEILDDMAMDLKKAKPNLEDRIDDDDYRFDIKDSNGDTGARINMQFNTYSRVWKIESF